jgi:TonB-dependent SusC/RagA subfamily outer membrane receptor
MRSSSIRAFAVHSTSSRVIRVVAVMATVSVLGACAGARPTPLASAQPASAERVDIGYGEIDRKLAPGGVSSLTAEQIRSRSVATVAELFETIPGTTVERTRTGSTLRIRNVSANNSAANTEPLIIIDGVPLPRSDKQNILAALNKLDIDRIDVLRDAAAAMYGVRGGRGVVLIKTKRGK